MTLSLAWIRKIGQTEELVFASDSRLRNGMAWDACPKIFKLPRNDSAITFCGATSDAYPFILQLQQALSSHQPSLTRAMSLTRAKGHFLKILNSMRIHISDLPVGENFPPSAEAKFIVGGYCWEKKSFLLWQFRYESTQRRFVMLPEGTLGGMPARKSIRIIGDPNFTSKQYAKAKKEGRPIDPVDDVQRLAYDKLIRLIQKRKLENVDGFDMEPFEVLVDMVKSEESPHVGGPPQLLKVYSSMNVELFSVERPWIKGPDRLSLSGRPLMDYEKYSVPIINADTLKVVRGRG